MGSRCEIDDGWKHGDIGVCCNDKDTEKKTLRQREGEFARARECRCAEVRHEQRAFTPNSSTAVCRAG